MEIGHVISGFKLVDKKRLDEANSNALLFEHVVTGARLLKLENDDDNKVFGIGFRTPPNDSTGVAHIVEHCVLSGSRKYKTKEPFMDMYKTSLQTFINAMTFPDKTIYPVASRNAADFRNLMDVYLDAVFYPIIGEKKEIFMQEGWHYELLGKEEPITYKGVVYNEMRGAMSTAEDQVQEFSNQALYPDSIYRFNSGGEPYDIPKLSYEDFVDFHKKYYHPSNSYIYLYGNGDTISELEYIETEYLSAFDRLEIDSSISAQPRFDEKRYCSFEYSTTDEVENTESDYLIYGVLTGDTLDGETRMMTEILKEALIDSDAAPIKRALIDAGIGEDVFSMGYSAKEIPFVIAAKNTSKDKIVEFENIIEESLKTLVEEGIDKKLLTSTLNRFEYNLREASGYHTRGIVYFIEAFNSWLYGQTPLNALSFNAMLEKLRSGIETGAYEDFVKNRILSNNHKTIVDVVPNKGLNELKDAEVVKELEEYKKSLSEAEIESLITENDNLIEMQLAEDSEEAKATIPKLSLSEINENLERVPREILELNGAKVLYNELFTAGINYASFLFDIGHITPEDIPYVALLSEMLGSMDTERRAYTDLASEIYIRTGGIRFGVNIFNDRVKDGVFYPKFMVSTKILGEDFSKAVELIEEISLETKLRDEKRFKEIVREIKSQIDMSIYNSGQAVTMARLKSYFDSSAAYSEKVSGIDFYFFIQDIEKNMAEDANVYIDKIVEVYKKVFNPNGLVMNIIGDRKAVDGFLKSAESFVKKLDKTAYEPANLNIVADPKNEGIKSSANVQYVSKGSPLKAIGYEYNGKMSVLSSFLSRGYLHNTIRAMGGAYGAGITINNRSIATYSYRDPNLVETIKAYDEMAEFLENMELSQEDLTGIIIGTMSAFDPPRTAVQKGAQDLRMYLENLKIEEVEKYMSEALSTKVEDIREYAKMIKSAMEENYLCVLGASDTISKNEELFDKTINLKK
ncbi:insulinase family protein [Microaceticoccus formicicus]|uniref:insulinase family protein n=1 Tax=Microaceticoccus formicicus TaxID=3118105 RepID=UPI003CD01893|nr:insulinase family protein [Peptoniphilaceae bacterium AMB_02]